MMQCFQDSMSVVRDKGKPDIFLTFTCNPKWPEIERELEPNQKPHERPDLITKIFNLKLKSLLEDIIKMKIFGRTIAHIYVIEFQKRGLPHAHLLIILAQDEKIINSEDIDNIVWAEIPDKEQFPNLYKTVTTCLLHGPCGQEFPNAPCMVDGKCSKGFPKQFIESTEANTNGLDK